MFTRRTATVTISAPLASTAARVSAKSLYFPVPTIRRDLNRLPPSSKLSSCMGSLLCDHANQRNALSAADEIDDLNRISGLEKGRCVFGLGDDLAIDFDRHPRWFKFEALD